MDERLQRTRIMMERLAGEVRRGSFRQESGPRHAVGWQRDGILFAAEVPGKGGDPGGQRATPMTIVTPHAHGAGWLLDKLQKPSSRSWTDASRVIFSSGLQRQPLNIADMSTGKTPLT